MTGNVYLSFQGVGVSSGYRESFDVMVGDNPPTVTGGYANWTTMGRPLQRAITTFQGYGPAQMQVDVRFGVWNPGWDQSDTAGQKIEDDIRKLERMAGATTTAGPPPVVYVWSYSSQGSETDLIPQAYRHMPWVINGGISWGKSLRNPNGYRIWQEASFTLMNYLNLSKPPAPDTTIRGGYFITGQGHNTVLLIAASKSSRSPTVDQNGLAQAILKDPKNNPCKATRISLERKSVSWPIRDGVAVWVPGHPTLG